MAEQHAFHVSVTGVPSLMHVLGFNAIDAVSRPFEAWLDVLTSEALDDEAILGATVGIHFGHEGESDDHSVVGVVEAITAFALPDAAGGRLYNYRLSIVHPLALLAWFEDCRIFQEMSVPDIVKKVLEDANISGKAVEWRTQGSYQKRDFCVQYNESIFAFISRLCEAEGIYYFVEFPAGDTDDFTLVFSDDSTSAKPVDGDPELKYVEANGLDFTGDSIVAMSACERVVSGKFTLRDFNLETPKVDLTADAKAQKYGDLEVYDYPGGYDAVGEGKRLAKVRLDAEAVEQTTVSFDTNTARLGSGRILKIVDAEDPDVKGEYFLTSLVHRWERTGSTGGAASVGGQQYRCSVTAIPKAASFRPAAITPQPIIAGAQTATVVCPSGAPMEEIHTDKYGRAKLKFHWDKSDAMDDKASAWFRVGQVQTSGSQALPRLNWEVIVEFLEGNPDRPIVTGKLYNGMFMPPYALPGGKSRTSIGSSSSPGGGGKNEIRFEDKAGAEEIAVNSQHNTAIKAANNSSKDVGNNESKTVGGNVSVTIGSNEDVKITKGSENGIDGNQSLDVGGMRKVEVNAVTGLTVGGDASISVGAAQMEFNGNPLEALIALAVAKAAEAAAAAAQQAIAGVTAAVQDRINQVMGPVDAVVGQAQAIGQGMQAVANGDMGAAAGVLAGAAGLPGADAVFGGGGGGGGGEGGGGGAGGGGEHASAEPAATTSTGGAPSAGAIAATNMASAAITNAIQRGIRRGAAALAGDGEGAEGAGGGGGSAENTKGPAGDVGGADATDRAKGPGHSLHLISGSLTETVGAAKVLGAVDTINTSCSSMTETIGAARAELVAGSRSESVEGMKSETTVGLIVISRADETEKVGGMKTTMVGGAIAEKIGGNHSIEAGAMATFISAFHKVEAEGTITFKCGASEIVVDDGGVKVTSPMVMVLAGKIQIPKATTEV